MKKKKHRLETLSTDSGARLSASKACVIMGKFLNLSVAQFPVCKMWITIVPTSYILSGLNELLCLKCLE